VKLRPEEDAREERCQEEGKFGAIAHFAGFLLTEYYTRKGCKQQISGWISNARVNGLAGEQMAVPFWLSYIEPTP